MNAPMQAGENAGGTDSPGERSEPDVIMLREATVVARADPSVVVLDDVTWRVRAGGFWVAVGLPGSGKSHLLEAAAGLLPPWRGEVQLFGETAFLPGTDQTALRRRVGFVFADGGRLFGSLTVAQNVGLPICYHGDCELVEVRDRVMAVLARMGLEAWADEYPRQLPRTLRHRLALARALALEPELLFLDNPLIGLDAGQVRWWLGFLDRWRSDVTSTGRGNATLVIATDDVAPWLGTSAAFGVVRQGRWQAVGDGRALLASEDPGVREVLP